MYPRYIISVFTPALSYGQALTQWNKNTEGESWRVLAPFALPIVRAFLYLHTFV